jgi:hypothetical protein
VGRGKAAYKAVELPPSRDSPAGAVSQEQRYPTAQWDSSHCSTSGRGLEGPRLCSWVRSIVEIDGQHVA